jgi:hypothetical protein
MEARMNRIAALASSMFAFVLVGLVTGCESEPAEEPVAQTKQAYGTCDAVCAVAGYAACAAVSAPTAAGATVVSTPYGGVVAGVAAEIICGEIWDENVCAGWCDNEGHGPQVCWSDGSEQGCVTCCQEVWGCHTSCAYPSDY